MILFGTEEIRDDRERLARQLGELYLDWDRQARAKLVETGTCFSPTVAAGEKILALERDSVPAGVLVMLLVIAQAMLWLQEAIAETDFTLENLRSRPPKWLQDSPGELAAFLACLQRLEGAQAGTASHSWVAANGQLIRGLLETLQVALEYDERVCRQNWECVHRFGERNAPRGALSAKGTSNVEGDPDVGTEGEVQARSRPLHQRIYLLYDLAVLWVSSHLGVDQDDRRTKAEVRTVFGLCGLSLAAHAIRKARERRNRRTAEGLPPLDLGEYSPDDALLLASAARSEATKAE